MYTGVNNAFQRLDYLLRAFAVVVRQKPDALLAVVSPLDDEPNLEANRSLAAELNVADRVKWIGGSTLADLRDYLAMADVAVLPRPAIPGHPIKLINYMAAAKPIVCFAGGAKGLRHEYDGLIVPDHDWRGLGEAILRLLRDPELAKRLGANAGATMRERFELQIVARSVASVYDRLLEDPACGSAQ